jgi:hypothetical protein
MPGAPLLSRERDEIHAALTEDHEVPCAVVGRRVGRHPTMVMGDVKANGGRNGYRPAAAERRTGTIWCHGWASLCGAQRAWIVVITRSVVDCPLAAIGQRANARNRVLDSAPGSSPRIYPVDEKLVPPCSEDGANLHPAAWTVTSLDAAAEEWVSALVAKATAQSNP